MGFLNNLMKKASKIVSDAVESNILNEVKKTVEETLNLDNNGSNSAKTYTIPEKYNMFPKYEGAMLEKPFERDTVNYCRITMRYNGAPNVQYISSLLENGFTKGSDVRYDKDNTYVIVDNLGNKTEIVYHIKK